MIKIKRKFKSVRGIFAKIRGCFVADLPSVHIHPLFLGLCAFLVFGGKVQAVVASVIAVFVHELGHSAEAYRHGYKLKKITLYPFGGVLDGETVSKEHLTSVAIAGPIANVVVALICISLKGVFPSENFITTLLNANIAVFAFNLLPAFPLDGARVITSLCKNEIRALKILRIVGIICSLLMFAAFVLSAFGEMNLTLGIISIFLFSGSVSGAGMEIFSHIAGLSPLVKNYSAGVEIRRVAVNHSVTISRVSSMLKPRTITEFLIVDDNGKTIAELNEDRFHSIVMNNSSDTEIGVAIRNFNN